MAERTELSPSSPQFAYLEYYLQLSLHASSASITTAYALSNPTSNTAFQKRCAGVLTLDTWLDPTAPNQPAIDDEVLRRGFVFSRACPGIKVPVGALQIADLNDGAIQSRLLIYI